MAKLLKHASWMIVALVIMLGMLGMIIWSACLASLGCMPVKKG